MRTAMLAAIVAAALVLAPARAADGTDGDVRRFDGTWTTIVDCARASDGALGYTLQFDSKIKDGVLYGERDREGQPGWMKLEGRVEPSGQAMLSARGLTADPRYSVNRVQTLSPYSYHVKAQFDERQGTGTRIELRKCELTFRRQ